MTTEEAKEMIKDIVRRTIKLIPPAYEKNRPPMKLFPDVPEWQILSMIFGRMASK